MNPDEKTGEPMAVLIGKDGQEIDRQSGKGTVEIMDGVEETEVGKSTGGGGWGGY